LRNVLVALSLGSANSFARKDAADDIESRDQIRFHLGHISKIFADGNFNAPMLIHEQTPAGVPVMQKLKSEIEYRFEETERGASIHISTANSKALQAIYKFLVSN
jgi:hypothetical protein